jgi:serine/threonine protein kinase
MSVLVEPCRCRYDIGSMFASGTGGNSRTLPERCIDDDIILAFAQGRLDPAGLSGIDKHISRCAACHVVLALAMSSLERKTYDSASPLQNRYELLWTIGCGGAGDVYAAYDRKLERTIAFKLLRDNMSFSRQRACLTEAVLLAQLSHPNVLAVFDWGLIDDCRFITFELIEGLTLADWSASRRPAPRDILTAFIAVASGLAAVHRKGIVHGDVKPQNIMIGNDNTVRLVDFGLARYTPHNDLWTERLPRDQKRLTRPICGTPAYMAPEQLTIGTVDALTDQFSFCVTFYECLYRRRPTPRASGTSTFPVCATEVSASVLRIICRGLHTNPAKRYQSMDSLLAALVRAAGVAPLGRHHDLMRAE